MTRPALQHAHSFIHSLTHKWAVILTKVSQHLKTKKSFTSRNTKAQVLCFPSWCQGPAHLSFRRHLSSGKQQHSFRFQHSLDSLLMMTETSFSHPNINNREKIDGREAIGDFCSTGRGVSNHESRQGPKLTCTVFLWISSWMPYDPEKPFNFSVP